MTELTNPSELQGKKIVDPAGAEIGEAREIYLEHHSDRPAFALVKTGLFGSKHTFVPLTGASVDGPRIWVTVDKERVRDAPKIDPEAELSPQQEDEVYRHYGVESPDARETTQPTTGGSPQEERTGEAEFARAEAPHASAPPPPAARSSSEPEFSEAGGESRPERPDTPPSHGESGADRALPNRGGSEEGLPRLRRYVVTEEVEVTVPVQREEVRVEPPQQGPAAGSEAPRQDEPERHEPSRQSDPARVEPEGSRDER